MGNCLANLTATAREYLKDSPIVRTHTAECSWIFFSDLVLRELPVDRLIYQRVQRPRPVEANKTLRLYGRTPQNVDGFFFSDRVLRELPVDRLISQRVQRPRPVEANKTQRLYGHTPRLVMDFFSPTEFYESYPEIR